jgi:hypothetical protein
MPNLAGPRPPSLILAWLTGLPNEPFLNLLCHPEVRDSPFWNCYAHTSPGITASASFMNPDRKCSESAQLDAITAHQGSSNLVENSADDCLDFLTLQVLVLVPYASNEIGPDHGRFLLGRIIAGAGVVAQFAGQSADFRGDVSTRQNILLQGKILPRPKQICRGLLLVNDHPA